MDTSQEIFVPVITSDESFIPTYGSVEAAGADIKAAILEPLDILPGASALIPTGIKLAIPKGFEIQIRPRSGLALKNQITVLNTPGTIDSDYRGEIKVILINHSQVSFQVTPGMRIAQMVLAPVFKANFVLSLEESLSATLRGEGGFGHSGTH